MLIIFEKTLNLSHNLNLYKMKFVSGSFSITNDLENNGFILNFRCVNDRIKI